MHATAVRRKPNSAWLVRGLSTGGGYCQATRLHERQRLQLLYPPVPHYVTTRIRPLGSIHSSLSTTLIRRKERRTSNQARERIAEHFSTALHAATHRIRRYPPEGRETPPGCHTDVKASVHGLFHARTGNPACCVLKLWSLKSVQTH